jgi:hypothetical protein
VTATVRAHQLAGILALATSCGGGDGKAQDAGIDVGFPDAPESMPTLTSFVPTPSQVPAGVATAVTWSWTYLVDPPIPPPTCTIDNGVGEVTRGQSTMVTLTATTTFRLTCANRAGMTARDTVISIPPAPPTLATFTATPSPLMPNTSTTVTFDWTYSTVPSPPPTCTIDAGIGAATKGMTAQLTLPQARTFRLRCTSSQGTSIRDVTVGVDECSGGTHDCNANANCTDTVLGFTCTCKSGYASTGTGTGTGSGDVCSATNLACTTPGVCSANAQCVGGTTCVCNTGYVGDGLTCTRARLTFVTSTTYNGNIGGVTAADAACQGRATAAGLPGTYIAWLSDSTSDAYCRVHGLTGKKATMCGETVLPATAGPWVRTDPQRLPAAPTIDKLLAPARQTFYPVTHSESGAEVTSSPMFVWTGTDDNGVLTGAACDDWTSADGTGTIRGAMGDLTGGGTAWTDQGADPTCSSLARLRCVEVAAGSGPALPSRHPAIAKKAFLTSVSGTGVLGTWADAQDLTGISAADAICQSRARYAGFANAASFKAWASYSFTSVNSRIVNNGPWYRPDGILIATSESDLTDARLAAPLYLTETGVYASGNAETGSVWTGSYSYGSYHSSSCSSWTSSASTGVVGRFDVSDYRWAAIGSNSTTPTAQSCSATDYRLYCLEDTP